MHCLVLTDIWSGHDYVLEAEWSLTASTTHCKTICVPLAAVVSVSGSTRDFSLVRGGLTLCSDSIKWEAQRFVQLWCFSSLYPLALTYLRQWLSATLAHLWPKNRAILALGFNSVMRAVVENVESRQKCSCHLLVTSWRMLSQVFALIDKGGVLLQLRIWASGGHLCNPSESSWGRSGIKFIPSQQVTSWHPRWAGCSLHGLGTSRLSFLVGFVHYLLPVYVLCKRIWLLLLLWITAQRGQADWEGSTPRRSHGCDLFAILDVLRKATGRGAPSEHWPSDSVFLFCRKYGCLKSKDNNSYFEN